MIRGQERFRSVRRRGRGANRIGAARQDPDDTSCASSEQRWCIHGEHMGLTGGDSDAEDPSIVMGSEEGGAKGHRETNRSVSDRSLSGKRSRAHGRARARAMGQWLRYDVGRGTRFGGRTGGDGGDRGEGAATGAASLTSGRGVGRLLLFPPCCGDVWRVSPSFSCFGAFLLLLLLFFDMTPLYQKTFLRPLSVLLLLLLLFLTTEPPHTTTASSSFLLTTEPLRTTAPSSSFFDN